MAAVLIWSGCHRQSSYAPATAVSLTPRSQPAASDAQIALFCGDCHALPDPATFPKQAWRHEAEKGFNFYKISGRHDLAVPPLEDVVKYYESGAPERLVVTGFATNSVEDATPPRFRRGTASFHKGVPAASYVEWLNLDPADDPVLLLSDMRKGRLLACSAIAGEPATSVIGVLLNPSRASKCDLDGDGAEDLVVGDLGSFVSEDHDRGELVWLKRHTASKTWQQRFLVSQLGRVADVRPADFDANGKMDLVVAEFGHLQTGRVLIFENLGLKGDLPAMKQHVIDPRHGSIHVPVADLNADGRPDFVALISQEHEVVEAYLNQGDFRFEKKTIFEAGDPSWGSSGIELSDLDRDGDLDVVYINGDTFGSDYLKPYHGISWLENTGSYPFVEHRLTTMIGVQAAVTADLDGDHDLDMAAGAFLPDNLVAKPEVSEHDSLIWLEQVEPGKFRRHALESGRFEHAALDAGDFDGDGDLDLAAGNFQDLERSQADYLTIWWNDPDSASVSEGP